VIALDEQCRLAFCVGVGGVGKTTFAAALALQEAVRGRSVLVLTADPARRLADALGIHRLDDVPSTVSLPGEAQGSLRAVMLETKASADHIIRRAAREEARAQRVLDNRIYQAFSNTLARSHAYAAMERVHEAMHDEHYDLIVVDTPPAQSSIEILDAPDRLVTFLDQRVVRWFLDGSGDTSGSRLTLAQRLLRTVAGDSLVAALTEFLTEMSFLRDGFAQRAREVQTLMRSPSARFILVSSADSVGLEAGRSVAAEVRSRGFTLDQAVFNRGFIEGVDELSSDPPSYPPRLVPVAKKLRALHAAVAREQRRKAENMKRLRRELDAVGWALPEATRPLADPRALTEWLARGRPLE
jgi:anion-transporting  ArsA/GET3 family ATPase